MPRSSAEADLGATVLVVLASLARWGLDFIGHPLLPFTTYYPAILFATYIGGFGVGCYAIALGGLIGWWAFLPPHFLFFVFKPSRSPAASRWLVRACGVNPSLSEGAPRRFIRLGDPFVFYGVF
jgi:hypothetical protein